MCDHGNGTDSRSVLTMGVEHRIVAVCHRFYCICCYYTSRKTITCHYNVITVENVSYLIGRGAEQPAGRQYEKDVT